MGKLTLLLLALLVWLQYSLWFGKTVCTTIAG
jgi:cell division protein FtsB